jgi:hypothetical protein
MAEAALPAAPASPGGSPARTGGELDDLMLAMDVVDTIRHDETYAARELDEAKREEDLFARLRAIYRGQGIEVPDRLLREGVAALKESRFAYSPPPPGLGRTLALLWVSRDRYVRALGVALAALLVLAGAYWAAVVRPRQEAARNLSAAHAEVLAANPAPAGRERAHRLLVDGRTALERGDRVGAARALETLRALRDDLPKAYVLRIVGEVMRPRRTALHLRDHYLVVEARAPDGGPVEVTVTPEDDGEARRLSRFAVKVPEDVYIAVERDRRDDGVLQNDRLAEKRAGEPDPDYAMPVSGGVIARW